MDLLHVGGKFMEKSIREQLLELAEEDYRKFTAALTPGKENILGIRIPLLRKLSKSILKGDWRAYLIEAKDDSMEEVMLQGMVIGGCKVELTEKLALASDFIPKIDCWSVCDNFCNALKDTALKYVEEVWKFLQPYLHSEEEYKIRFGVVMLLYYLRPDYAPLAFEHFNRIKHEGYYVKMAVSWVLSMYYVKLPDLTMEYLKDNTLDNFTYNKSLQKIVESLRIDADTRILIKSLRRK
jgi:3-methyladenine DNA glycosylase AlkD